MRVAHIPQFAQISTPEKLLFLEDLGDSISAEDADVPVPQSHRDELDARLQSYEADPGQILSLEELQKRIDSRK